MTAWNKGNDFSIVVKGLDSYGKSKLWLLMCFSSRIRVSFEECVGRMLIGDCCF